MVSHKQPKTGLDLHCVHLYERPNTPPLVVHYHCLVHIGGVSPDPQHLFLWKIHCTSCHLGTHLSQVSWTRSICRAEENVDLFKKKNTDSKRNVNR